jgi:catechol 2,3-dioxygenase-like lactoylglutathione lyase family enzyme
MLKTILVITISVLNLGSVESAYQQYLGYELVERGEVSEALGEVWNAPSMAGHDYLIMRPASEANVYIRFIEDEAVADYAPMATQGWNATELLVTDPDALAARLADSPFEIVGPPADLWDAPNAPRAMQAIGPGNEVLYLTRNPDFATESAVDRTFIMVLGGPSMAALSDFYTDRLGLELGDTLQLPVPFMADAQEVAPDTLYTLRVAIISQDFLLELDEYPATVPPRPVKPGHLPPGTAMVSFEVDNLDALDVDWRATPAEIDSFPYNGRRTGVIQGPAGEWLELIETGGAGN